MPQAQQIVCEILNREYSMIEDILFPYVMCGFAVEDFEIIVQTSVNPDTLRVWRVLLRNPLKLIGSGETMIVGGKIQVTGGPHVED